MSDYTDALSESSKRRSVVAHTESGAAELTQRDSNYEEFFEMVSRSESKL